MQISNDAIKAVKAMLYMQASGQEKRFADGLRLAESGAVLEISAKHAKVRGDKGKSYLVEPHSGACACSFGGKETRRLLSDFEDMERVWCKHAIATLLTEAQARLDGTFTPARAVLIYIDRFTGDVMTAEEALNQLYPPVA